MIEPRLKDDSDSPSRAHLIARYVVALLIIVSVSLYVIQSLRGRIQRIDTASVALLVVSTIAVVLLVMPGLTDRLSRIEVSGVKLEILKREQLRQRSELDEFSLIFPILLPETERKHLMNLAHDRTADYKGNHAMRTELRRLRSIGLIGMLPNQELSFIKDGMVVDLAQYVELTVLGKRWVQRIEDAERVEARAANAGGDSRDVPS
jgi:hypothetical protein